MASRHDVRGSPAGNRYVLLIPVIHAQKCLFPLENYSGNHMTVSSPFGSRILADDIIDALGFFDTWEDRYKYIIDLGKELPPMAQEKKDDQHLVRGCQS